MGGGFLVCGGVDLDVDLILSCDKEDGEPLAVAPLGKPGDKPAWQSHLEKSPFATAWPIVQPVGGKTEVASDLPRGGKKKNRERI